MQPAQRYKGVVFDWYVPGRQLLLNYLLTISSLLITATASTEGLQTSAEPEAGKNSKNSKRKKSKCMCDMSVTDIITGCLK